MIGIVNVEYCHALLCDRLKASEISLFIFSGSRKYKTHRTLSSRSKSRTLRTFTFRLDLKVETRGDQQDVFHF